MPFAVFLQEYERGWGSKIDDVIYFEDSRIQDSVKYVKDFNSKNTEEVVPDWYMVASPPQFVEKLPPGRVYHV